MIFNLDKLFSKKNNKDSEVIRKQNVFEVFEKVGEIVPTKPIKTEEMEKNPEFNSIIKDYDKDNLEDKKVDDFEDDRIVRTGKLNDLPDGYHYREISYGFPYVTDAYHAYIEFIKKDGKIIEYKLNNNNVKAYSNNSNTNLTNTLNVILKNAVYYYPCRTAIFTISKIGNFVITKNDVRTIKLAMDEDAKMARVNSHNLNLYKQKNNRVWGVSSSEEIIKLGSIPVVVKVDKKDISIQYLINGNPYCEFFEAKDMGYKSLYDLDNPFREPCSLEKVIMDRARLLLIDSLCSIDRTDFKNKLDIYIEEVELPNSEEKVTIFWNHDSHKPIKIKGTNAFNIKVSELDSLQKPNDRLERAHPTAKRFFEVLKRNKNNEYHFNLVVANSMPNVEKPTE